MFIKIFSIIFLLSLSFSALAQNFQQIADGIEYAEVVRGTEKEPIRANLLRLDLTKVRLDVVHALDAAIGLEKTSSIAARHGAIAAINAGFFRLDKSIFAGDDVGVLQIDGKLLSESFGNRIALGILNRKEKTEVNFGHLIANWEGGYVVDSAIVFSGVNRERKANEVILYTPEFHRTTLTDSSGMEIILDDCSSRCHKTKVIENTGSAVIPSNGYVISIGKDAKEKAKTVLFYAKKIQKKTYDKIALYRNFDSLEAEQRLLFYRAEDIVAGVPQLIKNGKIEITWEQEKTNKSFVETKHPRTAVAKLKDGKFLMVTVDGRSESSGGMSLQQLAEFLLEQGATDAMNLDGGGSTTMFLNGKVVNHPSDKEGERSVGDAILVFPRKKQ